MTPEQAAALRAPFPPEAIGKLPKLTCKACSNASSRNCEKHSKSKCAVCGNWISSAHIDLDYVGHAGVRDRLLQVDPEWTWTPAAVDPTTGAPVCTDGGLWIAMTVAGVTRLGWGDGPDIKQRISDAIRNAAMTFGVALDLWSKEDLHASNEVGGELASNTQSHQRAADAQPPSATSTATQQRLVARAIAIQNAALVKKTRIEWQLPSIEQSNASQIALWDEMLTSIERELESPFVEPVPTAVDG